MYSYTNRRSVVLYEVSGLIDPKKGPKPGEVLYMDQNCRETRA